MNREHETRILLMPRQSAKKPVLFFPIAFLAALFILLLFPKEGDSIVPVGGKWSRTLSGQSFATPAAANRLIYVGTNKGILYVFDGLSGKSKWRFETDHRTPVLPFLGKDGMIYLCSDDGALYVISAFTGKLSWKNVEDAIDKYAPSPKLPYYHVFSPALRGNRVFLSTPVGNLHAFDIHTGENLWTFSRDGNYVTSPSVYRDVVFIGAEDGRLTALDAENGEEKWSFQAKEAIHYPPAVQGNRVYFGSTDKKFYALNFITGKLEWSYSAEEAIESAPIMHKNLAYFSSSNGKLSAVNIDEHRLQWRFDAGGSVVTQPVFDKDTIYLGSNDGKLYALDSRNGELIWAYNTGGLLVNPVAISEKYIYVVANTKDGNRLNTKILAFQRGAFPGKEVEVYGHKESPFLTPLIDYFSATAKDTWQLKDKKFDLPEFISWPFGFQFSQAKQVPLNFARSKGQSKADGGLRNNLDLLSSRFAAHAFLFSLALTPLAFVSLLALLLIGGSLLLILAASSPAAAIFMQVKPDLRIEKRFSFVMICARTIVSTMKNYGLILAGFATTTAGILISLFFFNHLSRVPRITPFYFAIILTWTVTLITGSLFRATALVFLRREELNLSSLFMIVKHGLAVSSKIFAISSIYLACGILMAFLLGFGESNKVLFLTYLATLVLAAILTLTIFADSYVAYQKTAVSEAFRKSSSLVAHNKYVVAGYVAFITCLIGLCSLLTSTLMSSSTGIIMSIFVVATISAYLVCLHSNLFQELEKSS